MSLLFEDLFKRFNGDIKRVAGAPVFLRLYDAAK